MHQTESTLLQLIQKSLWNIEIPTPDGIDWQAVLEEAEKQAVLGIVIGAAPSDTQNVWKHKAGRITGDFVRVLHYQGQLYDLLKENGIPMVILKGTAAAVYYPDPSQRTMGDIDFLVLPEYFDRAKELLAQNDYRVEDNPKAPRHLSIHKDEIRLEQHRYFSYEGIDVEKYVVEGAKNAETKDLFGTEFPMLPRLANGLVLLGHMIQHLKNGLGLRQVIDWMLYVDRELDDPFWEQSFEAAAKDTGLKTAAIVITRMCQMYLGLKEEIRWCKSADTKVCTELMENVLSSGNFDRKRGKGSSIESVSSSISRKGLFRYLQTAGEYNWKAYQKHKWLKPFAWMYQIGRYAKKGFGAKRTAKQLKEDIERGRQRSRLLKDLGIDQSKKTPE